ncbi:PIG-L deacetylase family protein [Sphingomonas sp. TZW2008]|uniref:PIG-L deacetylase family protein n=1 Tax=Sphingomonas sp. TZW2008 TaxID=1917973 RepID=UPI000A26B894|nr:PIG-L family deacetylase [Sphingomonas sp. TZW2008]
MHVVAISPHLDDAAFSIGGLLAAHRRRGDRVTIVTCFTGNVARPQGFALACQLDKGLAPDVDYMALRRDEDRAAAAVIEAEVVHLPHLEAPHRGYASAAELFSARRDDDDILPVLTRSIAEQIASLVPDLLLGPMAIGDHVDHWLVRDAIAATSTSALFWEDWPYLTRAAPAGLSQAACVHALDDADRAAQLAMCAAYTTQIGFQFGSADRLTAAIAAIDEERLHAL